MAAIKRFFEKKKLAAKFKVAGTGHSLSDDKPKPSTAVTLPSVRHQPSSSASRAGAAALTRFQDQQTKTKKPTSSNTTWKHKNAQTDASGSTAIDIKQMKRDMMGSSSSTRPKKTDDSHTPSTLAVSSLTFCCPLCPMALPKPQIYDHLRECLEKDIISEPLMITITMIHSLNPELLKVQNCITILSKYLQNIVENRGEEKYRKIRKGNKVFMEKVETVKGAHEFLINGCGYELKLLPFESGGETGEQEFYVLSEELASNVEQLIATKEMLLEAEPLLVTLDRNLKVYSPSSSANRMEVPASFYSLTSTELKAEKEFQQMEIEKMQQLRTKTMRENQIQKRIYHYLVLRIRFPDGNILQGVFACNESLEDVKAFVIENLQFDWLPFALVDSIGQPFSSETAKLSNLKLAPASVINFTIESNVGEEITAASPNGKIQYLKNETLMLISEL